MIILIPSDVVNHLEVKGLAAPPLPACDYDTRPPSAASVAVTSDCKEKWRALMADVLPVSWASLAVRPDKARPDLHSIK